MADQDSTRVGVYIDFDNIVISRADQARREKLADPRIDLDAILDFASSYGPVTIARAYADWSLKKNADYRDQLIRRAVDLTQMFPAAGSKNGADIRLAIDAIEDLFRDPLLSHIVIVAGDSDYIPLAQRAKRLGRTVIGIGVAGSISHYLKSATDEFKDYDALPGVGESERLPEPAPASAAPEPESTAPSGSPAVSPSRASQVLVRAIRLLSEKDDREWLRLSTVKHQMLRMEPGFQESALGFSQFSKFVASRGNLVEIRDNEVRLRSGATGG